MCNLCWVKVVLKVWLNKWFKIAQDYRQFLFWPFFGLSTDRMAYFYLLKGAQDYRQFLFWPFFGLLPTAWLTFTP
jgi:hypothetical protein